MNFLLFVFAVVGLTNILVDPAAIAVPLRKFAEKKLPIVERIMSCYQCCGFWVGMLCAVILLSFNPLVVVLGGMAGSAIATIGASLLNYLDAGSMVR